MVIAQLIGCDEDRLIRTRAHLAFWIVWITELRSYKVHKAKEGIIASKK